MTLPKRRRYSPRDEEALAHHPVGVVPDRTLEELTGYDRRWIGEHRRRLGIAAPPPHHHPWLTDLVRRWSRDRLDAWMNSLDERRSAVRALRQQATALLRLVPVAEPVPVVEVPVVESARRPSRKARPKAMVDDSGSDELSETERAELERLRPKTRGDCIQGMRPCPWVSCRHHLLIDLTVRGKLTSNHGTDDPTTLAESCALDVADEGAASLDKIAAALGISRQRVNQLEGHLIDVIRLGRGDQSLQRFEGAFDLD